MSDSRKKLTSIADIHAERASLGTVTIAGWIRTRRGSKKFSFLEINDGTSAQSIQVIVDASLPNYEADVLSLTTGASVRIEGQLVVSPGQGQKFEIQASAVSVYGLADPESYPLQKKDMTYEYLRDVAHLRGRTATFASVFRLRARVSQAIHRFFSEKSFYYINTPILTTSDAEGAGETFQVTTLPLNKTPQTPSGAIDYSRDFFGSQAMLCVTGQLEAEAMALGLGRVYTFGPTFRAENSNTSRHLAEFWMIEPEMAFFDLDDTMDLAQDMIRYVVRDVLEQGVSDLETVIAKNGVETRDYLRMALEKPFVRVTYTEAVEILQSCGRAFEYPVSWGEDLKSEHERFLCEEHFQAPTFVYNYPASLKAFYMYQNDGEQTVRAMDLLMPGIGEVIGGSQREDRASVLQEKMEAKGLNPEHLDWYLDLRRYGGVPHSGFGLGLERLLIWMTGMGNVRDVIPFPRTPGSCRF